MKRSKAEEKKRLKDAVLKTVEKTKETSRRARETLGESEAQIFEIHAMLLEDEDFLESAFNEIENGKDAESAVLISADIYAEEIRSIGDEYLSARAADPLFSCPAQIQKCRSAYLQPLLLCLG